MQYWYNNNGQQDGPYDLSEFLQKDITNSTLVYRSDQKDWLPKSHFKELNQNSTTYSHSSNNSVITIPDREKWQVGQTIFSLLSIACYLFAAIDFAGMFFNYDLTGVSWSPIVAIVIGSLFSNFIKD